jgi:hypothetical protein
MEGPPETVAVCSIVHRAHFLLFEIVNLCYPFSFCGGGIMENSQQNTKLASQKRALKHGIGICGKCFKEFKRKVPGQRYCGYECRKVNAGPSRYG